MLFAGPYSLKLIQDNLLKLQITNVICSNHKSNHDKSKSNPKQIACFQIKSLCSSQIKSPHDSIMT